MTTLNPHDDPILRTKIQIPRNPPQRVARPRLQTWLEEESWRKLALVSAPAGSGKTTLVAAWAAQTPKPTAWLTLDEGDNSLERFFRYLIAALQKAIPAIGQEAVGMLNAPQPLRPEAFLGSLINDLEERSVQANLVLDDCHTLSSPAVHTAIQYLLDHLPDGLHLMIASRADPPLALARLRARSELTELRGQDLRFTTDEASEFLSSVMGLALSGEEIAALEERTEGWIAGLQLAALSMRGRSDTGRFIKVLTGSHRFILDYLVEEVLKQQPEEIKNFLLRTSLLKRMCAELCDTLQEKREQRTESSNRSPFSALSSQSILDYLDHSNLFLIPLDTERTWYRYHTLFADLLRYRLEQEQPGEIPGLHRRAAEWFQAKGYIPEAVQHYGEIQNWEKAAALVDDRCQVLLDEGLANQCLGWMDTLPAAIFDTNPRLHMLYGWGLLSSSQFQQVGARMALARQTNLSEQGKALLQRRGFSPDDFRKQVDATEAMVSLALGDLSSGLQSILEAHAALPPTDPMHASILTSLGAIYRIMGQAALARETFAQCVQEARALRMHAVYLAAQGNLGDVLFEEGKLDQAEAAHQQALAWGRRPDGSEYPVTCMGYIGLASVSYMKNHLDAALDFIGKARSLTEQWGNFDMRMAAQIWTASIHLALGNQAEALEAAQEIRRMVEKHTSPSPNRTQVEGFELQFAVDAGQLDWVKNWLIAHPIAAETPAYYLNELELLARASALRAIGSPQGYPEALALLDKVLPVVHAGGQVVRELPALIEKSLVQWKMGRKEDALRNFQEALSIGEANGYVRPFLTPGAGAKELLVELAARGASSPYSQSLLACFAAGQAGPEPAFTAPAQAGVAKADALSEREIEVLRLVALGLSNGQIAERLFLSEGTIKRHLHNIFSKLDVTSRAQAIHTARDMGLV